MGDATCRAGGHSPQVSSFFSNAPWRQFDSQPSGVAVRQRGSDIFRQGDRAQSFCSLESGWICLYHLYEDGRRQIVDFAVQGDLVGIHMSRSEHYDSTAHAITDTVLMFVDTGRLDNLEKKQDQTAINRILHYILQENHRLHQRLTAISSLSAEERIAFTVLDLFLRIRRRPARSGDRIRMPLTQQMIGESTGLTSIHVNRMLRKLRDRHVVALKDGWLTIEQPMDLQRMAHRDINAYESICADASNVRLNAG